MECPDGDLFLLKGDKKGTRSLYFGSRRMWPLSDKSVGQFGESVEGGCRYEFKYHLSKSDFTFVTNRISCPNADENKKIEEKILADKKKLSFSYQEFSSNPKKRKFYECRYERK